MANPSRCWRAVVGERQRGFCSRFGVRRRRRRSGRGSEADGFAARASAGGLGPWDAVAERVADRSIPGSSPGGPARPVWRWPGWRGPLHASELPMGFGVSPGGVPGGVEHRDHRVAVSCRCRRSSGRPCSGGLAPRLPGLLSGNDSSVPVTSETSWRVTCAIWVRRANGRPCGVSHALIPGDLPPRAPRRRAVAGGGLAASSAGTRTVAAALDVPRTTARDWRRRHRARAPMFGFWFRCHGRGPVHRRSAASADPSSRGAGGVSAAAKSGMITEMASIQDRLSRP